MPGLFGDFDADEIEVDIFAPPIGTWDGEIVDVSTYEYQGRTIMVWDIKQSDGTKHFKPQFTIAGLTGDAVNNALAAMKAFMVSLEVPVAAMNSWGVPEYKENFLGVPVRCTTVENSGKDDKKYVNLKRNSDGTVQIRRLDIGGNSAASNAASSSEPEVKVFSDDFAGL